MLAGFSCGIFYLIVQNVFDQLLVALQTANLGPVGLNKIILVQIQVWPTVHDVSDNLSQCKPLLSPCCMLVGLIVTVQQLENKTKPSLQKKKIDGWRFLALKTLKHFTNKSVKSTYLR